MFRSFLLFQVGLAIVLTGIYSRAQAQDCTEPPPNIILIIAEQMRGDALGILGNPNAITPHLDRMASEGVLFESYFVNNPVCSPSRMTLFSGLFPHQHGSISNKGRRLLSTTEGTLLGYARARGYRIGWFGKDNHTYRRAVLDEVLDANTSRRREPFRIYPTYIPPYWHGDSLWPEEHLFGTLTTNDAINFIGSDSERPFFVVLSLFDAHPPYFAPAAYAAHFPVADIVIPPYVDPASLSRRLAEFQQALFFGAMNNHELAATMQYYYASVEWGVDLQVGRVLQALDEQGITDQTIVVFTSDHGDFMGEYGMVRKGMFLYDALLHVPFIWYAPGRITAGGRPDGMAQGVDLLPTLIEAMGEPSPTRGPGQSLWPVLQDQASIEDRTVFAEAGYNELPPDYFQSPEQPFFNPPSDDETPFHTRIFDIIFEPVYHTVMARTKDWKLILSETGPAELYHLGGGWTENPNIVEDPANTAVLKSLRNQIESIWPGKFNQSGQ